LINEKKDRETFIFVHDQDIIIEFEKNNKFSSITNYKYVFLGFGDISLLSGTDIIIYAKDLPYNLELYPKMCAYSGWYVLYKNNFDLNEISYLSTFCDVIIGRGSGPYCFSHVKKNIFNENKTYISVCSDKNNGVIYQGKATNIWSNNYNQNEIIKLIKKEL